MNDDPESISRSPGADRVQHNAFPSIPDIEIDVVCLAGDWHVRLPEAETVASDAAMAALAAAFAGQDPDQRAVELSLVLADDDRVRGLNRDYRGRDKPTNVLSFPAGAEAAPGGPRLLGDVILAFETLAREADEQHKPLADHLRHLVVHGVLHLLGHDHEQAGEAAAMEDLERRILAGLGVPDPYAEPQAVGEGSLR